MWIETIDKNLINTERATAIQTSQQGDEFQVVIEVVVYQQSRAIMRPVYRGDKDGFDAFMKELKGALPMLPIGEYKPKRKSRKKANPEQTEMETE